MIHELSGTSLHYSAGKAANNNHRHFLIILGPFGHFTSALAASLRGMGATCSRVLLNGGDLYDWGFKDALVYRGDLTGFDAWLSDAVAREQITDVIVYGDAHPYCVAAKGVAAALGLSLWVMEQGYFRPFWVTLEQGGVNGNSSLPRDPAYYLRAAATLAEPIDTWLPPLTPRAVRNIFRYHAAAILAAAAFPRFRMPYRHGVLDQFRGHTRRYLGQKLFRARHAADVARALDGQGPLFVAILQRPGDSQLVTHSPFASVAEFIRTVIDNFAAHAPPGARLLFKSHPLDHGLERHRREIERAADDHGVQARVFFSDAGDLNTLIPHLDGAVTVNSTAGLAMIAHGVPTAVLGDAIYDMSGLTHRAPLELFWTAREVPDPELYAAFRKVVIAQTQIGGAYADPHGLTMAARSAARRLMQKTGIEKRQSPARLKRRAQRRQMALANADIAAFLDDEIVVTEDA
jgi:capsular polysaccharide export protein